MKFSKNFVFSFGSVDSHIGTTGYSLCRSIPIRINGSPVTCLLSNLPRKSLRISCPKPVNTVKLIFSIDGNWYFKLLPELMHAVHVLHSVSMFFFSLDHQKILRSASIFVEPGCQKCSASTTCHFISSGTTILSPANSKPNRSVLSLRIR